MSFNYNDFDSAAEWLEAVIQDDDWQSQKELLETSPDADFAEHIEDATRRIGRGIIWEKWKMHKTKPNRVLRTLTSVWKAEGQTLHILQVQTVGMLSMEWLEQHGKIQGVGVVASAHPEHSESLFHFIHPTVGPDREWQIHNEVKRLVAYQGVQEICTYLIQMRQEEKVLLPQMPERAYQELVRLGMPDGEGYALKTFMKYYKR